MILGIMDRYLLRRFLRAYLIALTSLIGLYVVIDAFDKLDEFTELPMTPWATLSHVGRYYLCRSSLFFDRLAGVIALMAAMFVVTWMRRNNELTPLITAGVSAHRVILPTVIAAVLMNVPVLVNQEFVIPYIADKLMRAADDPRGGKIVNVDGCYDSNGILLTGSTAVRRDQRILGMTLTFPRRVAGQLLTIKSASAHYVAAAESVGRGTWVLEHAQPAHVELSHPSLQQGPEPGRYVFESDVTFQQITRSKRWFEFISTAQLVSELQDPRATRRSELEVMLHARLTRPFLNITLLFLGLPIALGSESRRMVWNVGISLAVSASLHGTTFVCQSLGQHGQLPPALAAWLPLLFFGSAAVAINDTIQT